MWGIVAFALNFIPTFGSIIAAIPPTLLAMLLISPTAGIIVAGGYLVINTALGNCLEPMLLGRQFGIVTSMVLLSVIFWVPRRLYLETSGNHRISSITEIWQSQCITLMKKPIPSWPKRVPK